MFTLLAVAAVTVAEPPQLETGWRWVFEPQQVSDRWVSSGFTRMAESSVVSADAGAEAVVVRHVSAVEKDLVGSAEKTYDLHIITESGERLRSNGWGTYANQSYLSRREVFTVDPADVAMIGLAVLDLEGKLARCAEAEEAAAAVGATALPLPVIGEALTFDLPAMGGGRIRSEDLKGKVVLIDHWATWCGPCMEKMPELPEVYAEFKDKGLEVIGVSFDEELADAQAGAERGSMSWLHVHAASAAAGYDGDLWYDMTGIQGIPRLLLIDQHGVLQADFYPHKGQVRERVAAMLQQPDG